MRRFVILSLMLAAVSLGFCGESATATWTWNGKDLSGWRVPDPNPFWRVENGVLVGESDAAKKGSMLYTTAEYKDFEMETQVRWTGEIDSGIMFRKPELQLQIGISRSLKKDMTGSFYTGGKEGYPAAGRATEAEKLIKFGDWNKFRLRAEGDTYTVWINGTKAVEYTNPKYKEPGPIGLQIHPGVVMKVEFKDIQITPLDK